jgi:TPR repeat protein
MKAIEAGELTSLLNLAITYRMRGDMVSAKHWFEKALDSGDPEAALQLAKLYMVSEKEHETVRRYLELVINDELSLEVSREEAVDLLKGLPAD